MQDGKIISATGISAGIDMSLWLIGQIYGPDHARQVPEIMEYNPAPSYQGLTGQKERDVSVASDTSLQ